MKVLVTGGAGFIGSHVVDACLQRGDSVVSLDDFSTGNIGNVMHVMSYPRFRNVVGSISDRSMVARLVDACDVIFHAAAVVGMKRVVEQPLATFKTNVHGTQNVLEAAASSGKRVMLFSTSEIYGFNAHVPTAETEISMLGSTAKNRWSYAFSKAAGEVLAMAYYHEHATPVIIVRLFNTVGPRQTGRYGMVIPNFVRQALAGEPITVYGDGSQTRSFGDVHEIADALVRLMGHSNAPGEIFNVGNPHEVRIIDLAQRVIALTGSSSRIAFVSYDVAYETGFEDIMRRVPDVRKLQRTIGFEPQIGLDEMLGSVIEGQKQRLVAV